MSDAQKLAHSALRAGGRRNHVDGLDQPHPARPQREAHAAVLVGAGRQLLGGIQAVHRDDERAGERTVLVGQANGKILAGAKGVRIPFGDELEREAERPIALRLARRSRKHQALRAAREELAGRGAGLVAAGSQRGDRVEPFFLQVLIELLRRQLDRRSGCCDSR